MESNNTAQRSRQPDYGIELSMIDLEFLMCVFMHSPFPQIGMTLAIANSSVSHFILVKTQESSRDIPDNSKSNGVRAGMISPAREAWVVSSVGGEYLGTTEQQNYSMLCYL